MECKCNQSSYTTINGNEVCDNCGMFKPQPQNTGNRLEELIKVTAKVQGKTTDEILAEAMKDYCEYRELEVLEKQFGKLLQPKDTLALIKELRAQGVTFQNIAYQLNKKRMLQDNGNEWYGTAVAIYLNKAEPSEKLSKIEPSALETIKQLRAQGKTFSHIAWHLNSINIKQPNGNLWHNMAVSRAIRHG